MHCLGLALVTLLAQADALAAHAPLARRALTRRPVAAARVAMSVKSPPEAYRSMMEKGAANAKAPTLKVLHQSIMAGCYVGFGGLLSSVVAGSVPGVAAANPGLQKMIFAALFPFNLMLIVMTGGQLFTGNTASVSAALYEGHVNLRQLLRVWGLSLFGNMIGCGAMALAASYTGILTLGVQELAVATALKKVGGAFGPTLVKAILCNWLVCLAVWLAGSADDLAGKMVGIWFPISAFVAIGLEHSVANLFLLPLGLLGGAAISVRDVLLKNYLPAILGNAIAGAVLVGAGYSYAFGALGGNTELGPSPEPEAAELLVA